MTKFCLRFMKDLRFLKLGEIPYTFEGEERPRDTWGTLSLFSNEEIQSRGKNVFNVTDLLPPYKKGYT